MTECLITINTFDDEPTKPENLSLREGGTPIQRRLGNGAIQIVHSRDRLGNVEYRVAGPLPVERGIVARGGKTTVVVSTKPPISVDFNHKLTGK